MALGGATALIMNPVLSLPTFLTSGGVNMTVFHRCMICFRDITSTLADLHNHCDAYHYGQSPDVIFPHHGLHYTPMNPLLKRQLVASGEARIGAALVTGTSHPRIEYTVRPLGFAVVHENTAGLVLEPKPEKMQMRAVYLSNAWEELVCQNWVTIKTEFVGKDEIAVMEKF